MTDEKSVSAHVPALVMLSGARRGSTELVTSDSIRLFASGEGVVLVAGDTLHVPTESRLLATLNRRGSTYSVHAAPQSDLFVNGEPSDDFVLASGDVIELGRPGTVLRFRLYPSDRAPYKTLTEAFSDCVDCARYGEEGSLGKAGTFLTSLPRELAVETRPVTRIAVLVSVSVLVLAVVGLWMHNVSLEHRLAEESARVEGLAELLEQRGASANFTKEDFEAARAELERSLLDTSARITTLEEHAMARERVISESALAVVFLQGGYGFVEPKTGRPLRYAAAPDGRPVRAPDGRVAITTAGVGPVVEIQYSGTGFVIDREGHLLTNRHVAIPWEYEERARATIEQGFEPVMRRLIGYVPEVEEPFDVSLVRASDTADVALLRAGTTLTTVRPLVLAESPPQPGDEVIVLGYPTGMQALVARAGSAGEELFTGGALDFWTLARALSSRDWISPLATQGIVGHVTPETIVYDAETTHGGSGGPVLGLDGAVVAVNAAGLEQFGGSNLGVPAAEARRLLVTAR